MKERQMWLRCAAVALGAAALSLGTVACDQAGQPQGSPAAAPQGGAATTSGAGLGTPACPSEELAQGAFVPAGKLDDVSAVLPNGRRIRPAGALVELENRAMGLAVHPTAGRAYVVHAEEHSTWAGVWAVDLTAGKVVQKVPGIEAFHGITLTPDATTLLVPGFASGKLFRMSVAADGTLTEETPYEVGSALVDVEVSADSSTAYVLSSSNSYVYEVDLATGEVSHRMVAGTTPYALTLDEAGGHMFVSNLASGTVAVMDLASGETAAFLDVGKNPEGMSLDAAAHRLYVANSDSDTVSVIDTQALTVVDTWDLAASSDSLPGGATNAVRVDPATGRLYAAMARRNAIAVVDTATGTLAGKIATGHYPVALGLTPGGDKLLAVSAKGFGSVDGLDDTKGQLNIIDVPADQAALDALTADVDANNMAPASWFPTSCTDDLPPALRGGPDRPIKHVVLIIKENKTYDTILGDDPTVGDGDPSLAIFGEEFTPNTHRLARQFTNFDNFFSDPERSIQGHLWTTMADCNDYVEKIHQIGFALYGYEDATFTESGSIFEHCFAHGVSFRNYGELPGFGKHLLGDFGAFTDHKYPFWTMSVPDVEKAREFIREFDQGIFPEFVYIVLPNDHTYGGDAGAPTPEYLVADNDAGLGLIVEAITHSEYWPETAIFVIEDDPQGPPDHIHSHRSLCMGLSPYIRRGYVSSVHYSIPSLYATILKLLDLPPLNRNTLEAPPMYDIFLADGEAADYTPYESVPSTIPFATNPTGTAAAMVSALMDFSQPDRAEGLGMLLWNMRTNWSPLPPYAKVATDD